MTSTKEMNKSILHIIIITKFTITPFLWKDRVGSLTSTATLHVDYVILELGLNLGFQ